MTFSVVTDHVNKEKLLEELNSTLEDQVRIQTKELQLLNEELKERVDEEVSKNREKDETLIQQSKLAAMGDMISSIAHQWRQPLATAGIGVSVLHDIFDLHSDQIRNEEDKEDFKLAFKNVEDALKFLSDTIEDFRTFYTPSRNIEEFDIGGILESSFNFYRGQFGTEGIDWQMRGDLNAKLIGIPNQLRQVILNLIGNSVDAFPEEYDRDKFIRFEVSKGDFEVSISITDNAGGISFDVIDRVFEPYFTTKGPTSGTGIGLYMSKLIIEKTFTGTIEVTSHDTYTTFTIRIPYGEQ